MKEGSLAEKKKSKKGLNEAFGITKQTKKGKKGKDVEDLEKIMERKENYDFNSSVNEKKH